ncbi:hypothetical protein ACEWY4_020482 [Coilia grayii]|uniref:Integrase zinc-binding domain-containing protein n=1 Tax=Coilia grayii TaxID=363190 RepID=A0ABD1JCT4_9TELE
MFEGAGSGVPVAKGEDGRSDVWVLEVDGAGPGVQMAGVDGRGPGVQVLEVDGGGPGVRVLEVDGGGPGVRVLEVDGAGPGVQVLEVDGGGPGVRVLEGGGPGVRVSTVEGAEPSGEAADEKAAGPGAWVAMVERIGSGSSSHSAKSRVVAALTWDIESQVQRALRDQPRPIACPDGRLFVLEGLRSQVLQWGHDSPVACHPGATRTKSLLAQRSWWPSLD